MDKLKHLIALIVFGIATPVYAFNLAYSGSFTEMWNRLVVEYELSNFPQTQHMVLEHTFNPTSVAQVKDIYAGVLTLLTTNSTTKLVVTVKDNMGGYDLIETVFNILLMTSPSFVVMEIDNLALSNGQQILGASNLIHVPYGSVLLFHTGASCDNDGNCTRITEGAGVTDPEMAAAYKSRIADMGFWWGWLTPTEAARYKNGEDVFVDGESICKNTEGSRTVEVLYHDKDSCWIKGQKSWPIDLFDKLMMMKFGGY